MGPHSLQQSPTRPAVDTTLPAAADGSTDTLSEVELLRTYLVPGCSITWHEAADKQSPADVLQLMGMMSENPNRTSGTTSGDALSGARHVNLPVCWCGTVPLQCSRLSIAIAASDEPISYADVAFSLAKLTSLLLMHMDLTSYRSGDPSYATEPDLHSSALKALTFTFHRYVPKPFESLFQSVINGVNPSWSRQSLSHRRLITYHETCGKHLPGGWWFESSVPCFVCWGAASRIQEVWSPCHGSLRLQPAEWCIGCVMPHAIVFIQIVQLQ